MSDLKIDLSEKDLMMVFKEYEILTLETLWENPDHMYSSLEVMEAVNQKLSMRGESISRASIINFLQDMAEQGILERDTTTGKGGHRGIYQSKYEQKGLRKHLIRTVLQKLRKEFPEETERVIRDFKQKI